MNPQLIVGLVSKYFGVEPDVLIGKSRVKAASYPRQIACHLIRSHCYMSFESIGNMFSLRDHSTIMYYVRKVREGIRTSDKLLVEHVTALEQMVQTCKDHDAKQEEDRQQAVAGNA
jgi:chromosomal replication initiator protein